MVIKKEQYLSMGDHCKAARERARLSVEELSDLAGVKEEVIIRVERDKLKRVTLQQIAALAQALQLPVAAYTGHEAMPWRRRDDKFPVDMMRGLAMRAARDRANMTLAELADLSGVSLSAIRRAEGGQTVTYSNVELCADALGLSVDEYIGAEIP